MGNHRWRGRPQPETDLQGANHKTVEGFTALGWTPALGVQLPGDGGRTAAGRVQHHHPGGELGVVTQRVKPGHRPDQGRLGPVATQPVNLRVDALSP